MNINITNNLRDRKSVNTKGIQGFFWVSTIKNNINIIINNKHHQQYEHQPQQQVQGDKTNKY
jgi:hypothetical protein